MTIDAGASGLQAPAYGAKRCFFFLRFADLAFDVLDAGKKGLNRDTRRDAATDEVHRLTEEKASLKTAVAEGILQIRRITKSSGLKNEIRFSRWPYCFLADLRAR